MNGGETMLFFDCIKELQRIYEEANTRAEYEEKLSKLSKVYNSEIIRDARLVVGL